MLKEVPEGGYVVTTPLDPEMVTEADTVAEAYTHARDAIRCLRRSRVKLFRKMARMSG